MSVITATRALETGLPREEHDIPLDDALIQLMTKRVLVTGASGAVGQPVVRLLREWGIKVTATDIDTTVPGTTFMDVTDFDSVMRVTHFHDSEIILNLAAAKLAPAGEVDPFRALTINSIGCMNLLNMGRHVVQASTCKSIAACTAYGASKLISERLTLNHGQTVIRYYNIPTAGPSMWTIWRDLPEDEPIPVTDCTRYLISEKEATALSIWGMVAPPGRYCLDPGSKITMPDYASVLYPDREQVLIPPRRGDRIEEPLIGEQEWIIETDIPYLWRVESHHDAS